MKTLSQDVLRARRHLAATGWSYRKACAEIGYSYTHFVFIMTGRREMTVPLMKKVMALPNRKGGAA